MSTRKLRIRLSTGYYNQIPAMVDIDINTANVEFDLEVTGEGVTKEYTFDAPAGKTLVDIVYRDDSGEPHTDRNLIIESVEIAADGENYVAFLPGPHNTNNPPDWYRNPTSRNPAFNPDLPSTDDIIKGVTPEPTPWGWDPGSNPAWIDTFTYEPWKIWLSGTTELTIIFPS